MRVNPYNRSYIRFWLGSVAVVGGGLLFYEGVGMTHPLRHFNQFMVIRGVVVVVSRVVTISSVDVFAPVVVVFVFAFGFSFGVVPGAGPGWPS